MRSGPSVDGNSRLEDLCGVLAAVLVPRNREGQPDEVALEANLRAVIGAGVNGISIGGATGEYAQQDLAERIELIRFAGKLAAESNVAFVPAVGAAGLRESLRLAEAAAHSGARAVLLPPPLFFRYTQEDLFAYYSEAAGRFPLPVLIYNLPAFVSPVEEETAIRLLDKGIAGIKDSSGGLNILAAYSEVPSPRPRRFVGNDSALLEALESNVCDGCISGVAGVLPELLVSLCEEAERQAHARLLEDLLDRIDALPTPWSLKVVAEVRGWGKAAFPFGPSAERAGQIRALATWIEHHLAQLTLGREPALADGRSVDQ